MLSRRLMARIAEGRQRAQAGVRQHAQKDSDSVLERHWRARSAGAGLCAQHTFDSMPTWRGWQQMDLQQHLMPGQMQIC